MVKSFTNPLASTAMAAVIVAGAGLSAAPAFAQAAVAPQTATAPQTEAAAPAADGQDAPAADNARLGDVIVTARKRAESIDTVPLAITAMSSARIEARNLKSIEDVAAFSPGFFTQSATGTGTGRNDRSFRQLTFRGIGANSTNVGPFAGGVAFLDGTPVLNSSLANVQDLERVEVLRGPQAAYFGRSTFIGAVNYITKDPTDIWTGRITAEVGEDSLVDTSLSISGPITDWASFRVSGRHFQKDGQYRTRNSMRELGGQATDAVSATLLLTPAHNLRVRTFYNYFVDSDEPPAQYTLGGRAIGFGGSNCNLGGTLGAYYCGEVPQEAARALISANVTITPAIYDGLLANNRNFPVPFNFSEYLSDYGLRRRAHQFSNRVDYTFGDAGPTLTSTFAYHEEHIVTLSDFNFRATPLLVSTSVGYRDYDWSQELRLVSSQSGRFRWVVGGNYVKLKQTTSGIIGSFATFGILNFGQAQIGFTQAETPAGFAGLYFDIVPRLTLTVEGRYQADKITGHYGVTATRFADVSETFNSFSPRVSIDYKVTPTSTVYALFSRGYKPGGFNQGILTQPQFVLDQFAATGAAAVYDEEQLDNYEAGIRGSFLDGRARVALNGYIGRYRDAQIPIPVIFFTTQLPSGAPNNAGPVNSALLVRNLGSINLKGVEFEGEAIITPGLRIGGTFAYTNTDIRSYFCVECAQILAQNSTNTIQTTSPVGKKLPGAPEITYTLSASYETEFSPGLTAYYGVDYLYRGKYYAEAANVAHSGASDTVNARLGFRWRGYDIEVFARNLLDDESPTITYSPSDFFTSPTLAVSSGNTLRLGLPDRRRIGMRASVRF